MQTLIVFLAVFFGTAVAHQMVFSTDDFNDRNKDISSKQYFEDIFGVNSTVYSSELSYFNDILGLLRKLGLNEAARIGEKVGLTEILRDERLGGMVTLCLPDDVAVGRWMDELPEALRPDTDALKQLVKAWIIPGFIDARSPNNFLVDTLNGVKLRFNRYMNGQQKLLTLNGVKLARGRITPTSMIFMLNKVIYPLPDGDVIETLDDNEDFSILIDLLNKSSMTDSLKTLQTITLLAPTNAAFKALQDGVLDDLKKNPAKLQRVLQYHVISDVIYSAALSSGQKIGTVSEQGDEISVDIEGESVILNKETRQPTKVIKADIPTTNGVIHVIDHVLIPKDAYFLL